MDYKYRHGLAVMRAQPLHLGHCRVIRQMLEQCQETTIVLGSAQECGTERNPFAFEIRKQMILNCFPAERLHIMGLADINNPLRWGYFVLEKMREVFPDAPVPDVYYAGSGYDAHWFAGKVAKIEIVDRNDPERPFVSATMVRDMLKYGDERWKDFVPAENVGLIERNFVNREVKV